jgi:hypothetical protein
MINPYDEQYTVYQGEYIEEPAWYDLQVTSIKLNTAKNPCYEVGMKTPDGLYKMQFFYLSEKMKKYFVNFLKVVAREPLPKMIDEMDEGLIREIAVGGTFRAEFQPDEYNGKPRVKISWFKLEIVTAEEWGTAPPKKTESLNISEDDIPF